MKNREFWCSRAKIRVKRITLLGENFFFQKKENNLNFFSLFFLYFLKKTEFCFGRAKIRLKKENTLYRNI